MFEWLMLMLQFYICKVSEINSRKRDIMKYVSVNAILALYVWILCTPTWGQSYIRDTPYRELVPHRFQFRSQPRIANFNQLSFDSIYAISGCTVLDSKGWLLSTENGLTWFTLPNVNKDIPIVNGPSIAWKSAQILCIGSNQIVVIDQTNVLRLSIDDTEVCHF